MSRIGTPKGAGTDRPDAAQVASLRAPSSTSGSRRAATVSAISSVLTVFGLIAACASERPNAGGESGPPGTNVPQCLTPNEGCPCDEPGKVVDCGTVKYHSGDYVACQLGTRTCAAKTWGACVGSDVVTKSFFAGAPLQGLALGTGATCPTNPADPLSNLCDPYCNHFVDDPVGLAVDGGLAVTPEGGLTVGTMTDAGISAGLQTTSTGDSQCTPSSNAHTNPCNASPITSCQQDFRCDAASNTCVWNGGEGYFDATAGGVDLTIGAACDGGGFGYIPLCNRGSATVPAGTTLGVNLTSPASQPNGCTSVAAPPNCSTVAPTGGLQPGQCLNVACSISGDSFAVVNAGSRDVVEATGRCGNNAAWVKTSGTPGCAACTSCNTQLTGKVFDPGVNVPLANVTVFQPQGALTTLSDGVQCDTCAGISTPALTETKTDANGAFTLSRVTPGSNAQIVVQSGRWRRSITMNVPACTTTPVTDGTLRLPRNRTEGTIPKTALTTGSQEALECWLRKMGIDASEIQPRQGAATAARIQIYASNGMVTSPASPTWTTLLNAATLSEFSTIIMDCDGGSESGNTTTAQRTALKDYADVGGRIFMNHRPGEHFVRNGPAAWQSTATWIPNVDFGSTMKGKLLTSTPANVEFRDWLLNVGGSATYGSGWVRVDTPRELAVNMLGSSREWIRGADNNDWAAHPTGSFAFSYSFDTPFNAATTCGRVLFNEMHVSTGRTTGTPTGKSFPSACVLSYALTPEELALEYQLFQLTACAIGGAPTPPAPPPPPPLPSVTYVRDYQAACPVGTRPEWGFFSWQASTPVGTSIKFQAATANDQASLPPSPPVGPPTTVSAGTANTTVAAPSWGHDANTVAYHLANDTPGPHVKSQPWLRLYMTFVPLGSVAPTLNSWRQVFDCVPAE